MPSTERPPRARALRFGVEVFLLCAAAAAWLYLRKHRPLAAELTAVGGTLVLALSVAWPPPVLLFRSAWLGLASAIGWLQSRLILTVLFFVVLTPLGLLRRAFGKPPLDLRWHPGARQSYWHARESGYDRKHYEHPS